MGNRQASRLTHEEVELLLQKNPHFSCDDILDMYRQFRKDFPNGYIRRQDFMKSYSRRFQSMADQMFCNQLFSAHDTNGNDRVDFGEFLVGLSITKYGSTEQKLDWAFRMLNIDGDRYLTEVEIFNVLQAIYTLRQVRNPTDRARNHAAVIMRKLDWDNDGRLTKEEFFQAPYEYPYLMKIIESI